MLYRPGPRTFYIDDALLPQPPKGSHGVPNELSGWPNSGMTEGS